MFFSNSNNSISGTGYCNTINYRANEINASNLVSTTNYLEGEKTTITLSQNENCKIYTNVYIYMHTNNTTTAPIESVKAFKYKIISSNNVIYSGTVSYMGETLLATVPLTTTETTYDVYIWVDSSVSLGTYNDKSYSGYIYATSEQTSTIGKTEDTTIENISLETIEFDYVGSEQVFVAPQTGSYKLETWGAQGGGQDIYIGGYGGYSTGTVNMKKDNNIYVNIGQVGGNATYSKVLSETYNGGGAAVHYASCNTSSLTFFAGAGGGATHISTKSGLLSTLANYKGNLLIVSGGGGGANLCNTCCNYASGGSGGGIKGGNSIDMGARDFTDNGGTNAIGGTQISGYLFGLGGGKASSNCSIGGGGGFYGGINSCINGAGGGSGYIGNSLLTNKVMYCYNCEESSDNDTKTISTTCTNSLPKENCSKQGNGYAKITIVK